ncbi:MAG: DUF4012 domain-containing protein [Methanobrevibacter sp.]|uniref:DUF4012 domain-containing protein n=1 Tax=Methanobrevibacter sp. TaxID=66852 RepID=UPI0025CE6614|nr:DUF4012 domain-containing protein [Methanobrevibacter sp.]MBE6509340.1 DUF4012 domain-containing protein [Methanobrevibacter sp.]
MDRTKKLIIALIIIVLIGLVAIIAGTLFIGNDTHLNEGKKTILVCAIDESEDRPGMGACDMAFLVRLDNGTVQNYTPVYPGGLTHPNASEPTEAQQQGAGSALLLHDAFWDADNYKGMQLAKEIVEYRTNNTIDSVVAVNVKGLDAVLDAAAPLKVNGTTLNASGIDIIREEDWGRGVDRGDAVMEIVKAAADSAKDPVKKSSMVNAAIDQYSKGNIIMDKQGSFVELLASKGIETLFG